VALPVLFAMRLDAQIVNGLNFTTSFAFYANNARMPAGSYTIRPTDIDEGELQIESRDGKYSAFISVIPTQAAESHAHSDVTFHKYGNTDYLNRIWVEGQQYGVRVDPTKAEKMAAAKAKALEHSVSAEKR
jgi:hypothetical protein